MKEAIFVFVAITLMLILSSCNSYVAQDGYDLKNKIEFLDMSMNVVATYIVEDYCFYEGDSGIKVYTGNRQENNISSWNFVVWSGPYRLTRVEIIKAELERP